MFLDNVRIGTKALVPVVVMALMVLAIVIVGGHQLSSFGVRANAIIEQRDRGLVAVLKAARSVNRLKLTVFQSLVYDELMYDQADLSQTEQESKAFDDARARTGELLAEAQRLLPEKASEISGFSKRFDDIVESARSPLEIGQANPGLGVGQGLKPDQLDNMADGAHRLYQVDKVSSALIDDMTALTDKLAAENVSLAEDLRAEGRAAVVWLMAVELAATLIAGAMCLWIMSRKIGRPLSRLAERMRDLADGKLDTEIENRGRRDEVGQMASAVEVFKDHAIERRRMEEEVEKTRAAAAAEREATAERQAKALAEQSLAMRKLGEAVSNLANKNLRYRVSEPLAEAYEPLRIDLNSAFDQLQSAFANVARSVRSVGDGTREISDAANDLSKRTEQQASSLEETTAALAEITATVRKTAEGAENAQKAVGIARADADKSGEVVRQAHDAMGAIEKSSREISQIIGVIDEIAFQTNLLALNAGVEAARAGEAGRGFAVVASEVRGLAQRAAEAARQIKGLISTSTAQVEGGVNLVEEVGALLERIAGQVTEISAGVAEIAASAKEQSTGLNEVNTAVTRMDEMTRQNAAMAQEASAASQSLRKGGEQLSALVGAFEIESNSSANLRSELMKVAPHAFRFAGDETSPERAERSPRSATPAPVARTSSPARVARRKGAAAADAEMDWTEF